MQPHKIAINVKDYEQARTISGALSELVAPPPDAVTLFEAPAGWLVEAYYSEACDHQDIGRQLSAVIPFALPDVTDTVVPEENWVAISQAALPPVAAGRFTVHGSHDRGRVPRGPNTLLIDAGEAFGTAHHATTQGCLLAIDRLTRRRAFKMVLDLGCGSGVLALAAARSLPNARVRASDNDPLAVDVARENARFNGAIRRIDFVVAEGLPRGQGSSRRYDLILANILAEPLINLAGTIARAAAPGGVVVLSGLLNRQAAAVIAAYLSHGFSVSDHRRIAGWSTLTLIRRSGASEPPGLSKRAA